MIKKNNKKIILLDVYTRTEEKKETFFESTTITLNNTYTLKQHIHKNNRPL